MKSHAMRWPLLLALLAALVFAFVEFALVSPEPSPLPAAPAASSSAAKSGKEGAALHLVRIGIVRPALGQEASDALVEQQMDYLAELSKYTGNSFEAVPVSASDAAEALQTGKIDLLMPVEPHISDTVHFVGSRPLPLRDVIGFYRRPDDRRFGAEVNGATIAALAGKRVAIAADRTDVLLPFERFCKENDIEMTVVTYASDELAHDAFHQGDVDLILDTATSVTLGEELALAFDAIPMCIAGRSEHADDIDAINEAQAALDAQSPVFSDHMHTNFEAVTRRLVTHFTPVEQTMIEHLPTLHVALAQDDPSLSTSRELIETLAERTGITVDFVIAGNTSEARTMLANHTADIMPDVYNRTSRTSEFFFTDPLYEEEYILVGRNNAAVPKVGSIAVPFTQTGLLEAVQQHFPGWNVLPTADEQHALAAVSNGRTDLALSSVVSMQATRNLMLYPNLVLVPSLNKIQIGTNLAIARHEPRLLQAIFNKAMMRLDPQERQRIILKHEIRTPPHFSLTYFLAFYPLQTGLFLGVILLAFFLFFFVREVTHHRRRDILERAALENYKYQSQTDPLTGLYNKAAMRDMIAHGLLEPPAPGRCHAFFMCDLDHFKAANDLCGHSFGDDILIGFAESLRSIVRSRDLIGRFGGDEFVVFLKSGTDAAVPRIAKAIGRAAMLVDERLRTTNPEAQKHPERPLITVSIGVAIAASTRENYDTIFHQADTALYYVKEHGRGTWKLYDEALEAQREEDPNALTEPNDGR